MSSDNRISFIKLPNEVFSTDSLTPNKINLFFGRNGTGKSTIAKCFRDMMAVSLSQIHKNADIMTFDDHFVKRNIEQYSSMPGVVTVSEQNIDVQKKIAYLKQQYEDLSTQSVMYQTKLADTEQRAVDISKGLQETCWNETKQIRKTFDKALGGNKTKQKLFTSVFQTTPVYHNIEELESLYNSAFLSDDSVYPLYKNIPMTNCLDALKAKELMSKPIISSSDSAFSEFMKKLGAVDWVKSGHNMFSHSANGTCPYCQQRLPDDFESKLSECFDREYLDDIERLKAFYEEYRNTANSMYIPLQDNLKSGYNAVNENEYISHMKQLKQTIKYNLELIKKKLDTPSISVVLDFTCPIMEQINDDVFAINKMINSKNSIVSNRKKCQNDCKGYVLEHISFMLQADIIRFKKQQAELQLQADELTQKIQSCNKNADITAQQITELSNSICDTKTAVLQINELLNNAGFNDFMLCQSTHIDHAYEVIRSNGENVTALSEGEQRFLALLYFYTLSNAGDNDKILVIDDAFTGLDSEAADIVKALIQKLISSCTENNSKITQLFFLTHDKQRYNELSVSLNGYNDCISKFSLIKQNARTSIINTI